MLQYKMPEEFTTTPAKKAKPRKAETPRKPKKGDILFSETHDRVYGVLGVSCTYMGD